MNSEYRYVPFTQQKYCCVPTCVQMVMYKNEVPLVAQEEIGYEMGLTVPHEDAHLFGRVHTGAMPPAGWGTQIYKDEFSPNSAFERLGIPLHLSLRLIDGFTDAAMVTSYLEERQRRDDDVLICYDYGTLFDTDYHGGHVCVFDHLTSNGNVILVDPEQRVPKYREVSVAKLYEAMKFHGPQKSGGFWELELLVV